MLRTVLVLSISTLLIACNDSSPDQDTANSAASTIRENVSGCSAADLVLYNTNVYTSNDAQWTAQAVAVLDDRIVYVGDNAGAEQYRCGTATALDLNSSTVYAGFTDSHQHLEGVGRRTKTLSLFGIPTLQETVAAIAEFAANVPEGE